MSILEEMDEAVKAKNRSKKKSKKLANPLARETADIRVTANGGKSSTVCASTGNERVSLYMRSDVIALFRELKTSMGMKSYGKAAELLIVLGWNEYCKNGYDKTRTVVEAVELPTFLDNS